MLHCAWILSVSFFLAEGVLRAQTKPTVVSGQENVAIVVLALPMGDQVAVTYDHQVTPKDAQTDLNTLAQKAGWLPQSTRISHKRAQGGVPGQGASPIMTSVEFTAHAVDAQTRSFPLEAIVSALRRYKRIGAVFLVPPGYPYWGPTKFETDGVAMTGTASSGAYTFHFLVKDLNFKEFQIPLKNPAASRDPAPPPSVTSTGNLPLRLALVIVMALGVAGIVYGIASYLQSGRRSHQAD